MLVANQATINLGTLKFGKPHDFTYVLTNNSTKETTITGIVVGCGSCTKASTSQTIILPAATSTINVIFTPGSTGLQNKNITVSYKEGTKRQSLKLTFKAQVS